MATLTLEPTRWHNTFGPHAPALRCADGDTVIVTTLDAGGEDSEGIARAPRPNPVAGPVFVEGAQPGDALRVDIVRMTPTRRTGWTRSVLVASVLEPGVAPGLPRERVTWTIDPDARTARLQQPAPGLEHLVVPVEPMIGCLGVAPRQEQAISTLTSGEHGGNMDCRAFAPGATTWFPVAVPGALFALGDGHAAQGDGEIVGTGIETTFEVELRFAIDRRHRLRWPRGETAHDIFTVGNARPIEQALQHATTEMLNWLMDGCELSHEAASQLMGQCVRYEIGNVCNPAYTIACRMPRRHLPARRSRAA
jgi:amidase